MKIKQIRGKLIYTLSRNSGSFDHCQSELTRHGAKSLNDEASRKSVLTHNSIKCQEIGRKRKALSTVGVFCLKRRCYIYHARLSLIGLQHSHS